MTETEKHRENDRRARSLRVGDEAILFPCAGYTNVKYIDPKKKFTIRKREGLFGRVAVIKRIV